MDPSYWVHVFVLRPPSSVATVPAAALALLGAWSAWKERHLHWLAWLLSVVAYQVVFADKTYHHVYYSLPLTPVLAVLAALGLPVLLQRAGSGASLLVASALVVVPLNTGLRARGWYTLHHPELAELEAILDPWIPRGTLIVVNGGRSPSMMYFAHRKGWSLTNEEMTTEALASRHALGARYVVLHHREGDSPPPQAPSGPCQVVQEGAFEVRRLEPGCF